MSMMPNVLLTVWRSPTQTSVQHLFTPAVPVEHSVAIMRCLATRAGRAVAAEVIQERKVRTPQGSEPANGGVFGCMAKRRQVQQKTNQPIGFVRVSSKFRTYQADG